MARFLLSPGVLTREIDNSQYTTATPTGNVAALVGYAEKGPFEPTIVSSTEDFNQTFGYTLKDAPYLAAAAYKYFAQGENLLVIRAGDERDPDLYPQAAQYSSKKIRLGERDESATKGYQTFTRANALAAGTFAPGAEFGFELTSDHRAFLDVKVVEEWSTIFNENGGASADAELTAKIAYDKLGDKTFIVDAKENNMTAGFTQQKYGTGSKSGETLGDTINSTVYSYVVNGTFDEDKLKYTRLDGTYGAAVLGTVDMSAGYGFDASNEDLTIELGSSQYTITLDLACTNATEIVSHINTKLQNAVESISAGIVDLSGDLEAFAMVPKTDGVTYIGLRRKANITPAANTLGFTIDTADAATTLGLSPKQYLDSEAVYGTFHTEVDGTVYAGDVLLVKESTDTSAVSFEAPIDISITAPASGAWELADIAAQIQTDLDAGHDGDINNPARATAFVDSASGKVMIETKVAAADNYKAAVRIKNNVSNSLIDLIGSDLPVDGEQETPVGEAVITLTAAEKGSHGQNLVLRTETKTQQISATETENYYNAYVLLNGKEVSVHQRISWTDSTAAKFLPTLLANNIYLNMEAEDEDGNFVLKMLPDGDWVLGTDELPEGVSSLEATVIDYSVGTNGWTTDQDGVIDSFDADMINGLKKIYNPEVYDFNLVAAPGGYASAVQNEIQTLCESRHDCFGVIDAAQFGIGLGVASGLNHVSEINSMNENLNSSYVGAYWPWLQDYDSDNKQYLWLPPSIYALTQMVYTDNVADPWYATAGLSRGKITALDVEYSPTRDERDILYGDTNIINPIVKFVGEGIAIWGQKTAQRTLTSLDRINVRRLMIYAEKLIASMARGFLFEQNDAANWASFARQANAILEPIRQRRGLSTYSVACDAATNTAELVDQNIMAGKIFIQPVKTTEFIEVEFTMNSSGEVQITE